MKSEILLENEQVLVEKYVVDPGQRAALHAGSADRLLVFQKGGVLTSPDGRSTWWREARVLWQGAQGATDGIGAGPPAGSINTGTAPLEIFCVILKPGASSSPSASMREPKYAPVDYPNVPGEDLLENDRLIVQRFTVNPGQWEGVHAHHPNTLYIHIKGGQWAVRSKSEPEYTYAEASPDGEVGWMEPVSLSDGHESGNVGTEPIDLIWVTLKR